MRLSARVTGHVQGVFYRAATQRQAEALRLDGWVRNCPDRSVDLVAEGSREACEQLLAFCRSGPPSARVDDVDVTWGAATGEFSGFSVRW